MFDDDYLTLRLVRLGSAEKWQPRGAGLSFLFFRGGAGKLVIDSVSHPLAKGDVLVLNGESGGKVAPAGPSELVFSRFSLRVEHLYPLFSINEISLLQNLLGTLKSMKLLPGRIPLAVECQRLVGSVPPHFNLDHRSHLLRVVVSILSEEFKTLQHRQPGFVTMEDHLIQVFEQLSSNDLLTLSAGELAAKFGCSRRHLNRLFHQHFGFSVAALRMELRLLRAVSLLQDSSAKVINVAEQCGFNHLGLFNTCFKRRFGTSPGRWRSLSLQTTPEAAVQNGDHAECPFQSNGLCPMLGGPKVSKPAGSPVLQMRTAALSTVLAKPSDARGEIPKQGIAPVPQTPRTGTGGCLAVNTSA